MLNRGILPRRKQKNPSMDITTPRQNQKKLNERIKILKKNRKVITDDGNGLRVPSMFILMDTIPTRCLTRMPIRHFFITRTTHFTDTGPIMDTARRITVTIAVIIPTETSIVDITVEVGIHHFHGGRTKKAIYGSKIDVLAAHAA